MDVPQQFASSIISLGDKLINPIVGVYIPIIRIPSEGEMAIPKDQGVDRPCPHITWAWLVSFVLGEGQTLGVSAGAMHGLCLAQKWQHALQLLRRLVFLVFVGIVLRKIRAEISAVIEWDPFLGGDQNGSNLMQMLQVILKDFPKIISG